MNNKMFRKVAIAAAVAALFISSLACDEGEVIRDTNTACNDISSCVYEAPKELSNMCQLAGGYHDTTGTCVMP